MHYSFISFEFATFIDVEAGDGLSVLLPSRLIDSRSEISCCTMHCCCWIDKVDRMIGKL